MNFCKCNAPLYTELTNVCERCGCTVVALSNDDHSLHVDVRKAHRQEQVDRLTGGGHPPVWDDGQAGTVQLRLLCGVAALAVLAAAVWLLWPYLVGSVVLVAAWRVATRGMRRRRPRSSWSSLGRTAAAMYAAWNSRWLRQGVRVSAPARAGREHLCGECGRDDTVPF